MNDRSDQVPDAAVPTAPPKEWWSLVADVAELMGARGAFVAVVDAEVHALAMDVCLLNGRQEAAFAIDVDGSPFEGVVTGREPWALCAGRAAEALASETLFPGSPDRILAVPVIDTHGAVHALLGVIDPDPESTPDTLLPLLADHGARVAAAWAPTTAPQDARAELMTRQVRALQRMNRELAQLREIVRSGAHARADFLARISQQLRSDADGVLGMLNELAATRLDPVARDYVDSALRASEAMGASLDALLEFAGLERGETLLDPAPFDLRIAIEKVVDACATRAAGQGVELIVQIAPEALHDVVGDVGRVHQVLSSLLAAALDDTPAGHVLLTLSTPSVEGGHVGVRIAVEDTGSGREGAGNARSRGAGERARIDGADLPLPIVRQLLVAMGGTLEVTRRPGEGSTVVATMRLGRVEDDGAAERSMPLAGVRALVVDDVEIHRMVLRRQMGSLGMRVDVAPDGDTAFAMLTAAAGGHDPYRLALIDNVMPGLTGEDLGRALRADPRTAGLALMMFTATADPAEARRFARAGFDGFFVKPILPSMLQDALAAVMLARRTGRAPGIVTRGALAASGPAAAPAAAAHEPEGADVSRPLEVLLAEDNAVSRKVALRLLERLGHRVEVATNGTEAVAKVAGHHYDVVFMDCEMPEMDGYDATTEIRRREPAGTRVPIVALTASALPSDRQRCRACGMDDFLAKPVREAAVRAALRRAASARPVRSKAA